MGKHVTIPTFLTWLRVALIPLFVCSFYFFDAPAAGIIAWFFFAMAGVTDWLDGYLARRLGQTTRFGAFLDPVADKLMVMAACLILVEHYQALWMTLAALVIIGREITISALREWMAQQGQADKVKVSSLGKWKTFSQIFGLGFLIFEYPLWGISTVAIGQGILAFAVVMTIWSMIDYLSAAFASSEPE